MRNQRKYALLTLGKTRPIKWCKLGVCLDEIIDSNLRGHNSRYCNAYYEYYEVPMMNKKASSNPSLRERQHNWQSRCCVHVWKSKDTEALSSRWFPGIFKAYKFDCLKRRRISRSLNWLSWWHHFCGRLFHFLVLSSQLLSLAYRWKEN